MSEMKITCPICESENVKQERTRKLIKIRDVEVDIRTPLHHCKDCGEEFWVSGVDPDFMAIAKGATKEA